MAVMVRDLPEILALHKKWLGREPGGVRATLARANLAYANLAGANLAYADLAGANLAYADIAGANLAGATLADTNLVGANLAGATLDERGLIVRQIVPQEGPFVGFKKLATGAIAKLRILDDAARVGGVVGRKCRCSAALVLAIDGYDEGDRLGVPSARDRSFLYRIGEVVVPREAFDDDRRVECASGIHFFLTREEAEEF